MTVTRGELTHFWAVGLNRSCWSCWSCCLRLWTLGLRHRTEGAGLPLWDKEVGLLFNQTGVCCHLCVCVCVFTSTYVVGTYVSFTHYIVGTYIPHVVYWLCVTEQKECFSFRVRTTATRQSLTLSGRFHTSPTLCGRSLKKSVFFLLDDKDH